MDSKEQSPVISNVNVITTFFMNRPTTPNPKVTVYNVSKLFPWDRELASKYTVWKTDPVKACKDNFKFARDSRRLDLAKIWKICRQVAQLKTTSERFSIPWSLHPLGKPLLKSVIDHCINSGDFQTSAAILCCFWTTAQKHFVKKPNIVTTTKTSCLANSTQSSPNKPKTSPYLTVHGPIEDPEPKIIKDHLDKKSKFWFMKPGALNGALNTTSPYHTIQLGSHIPPPTSSKVGYLRCWYIGKF